MFTLLCNQSYNTAWLAGLVTRGPVVSVPSAKHTTQCAQRAYLV